MSPTTDTAAAVATPASANVEPTPASDVHTDPARTAVANNVSSAAASAHVDAPARAQDWPEPLAPAAEAGLISETITSALPPTIAN